MPVRPQALTVALLLCGAAATTIASAAPPAQAVESVMRTEPRLSWPTRAPRFRAAEYAATGLFVGGLLAKDLLVPQKKGFRWTGGVLFDDAVRDRLRADTPEGRRTADDISDVLNYGLLAYPTLVDAGLVAGAYHRSPEVALQMSLINGQSYALTGLVTTVVKRLGRRARPYTQECAEPGSPDCNENVANESFFSGHAAVAFTGAGLICAHHRKLPLYGGGAADRIACGAALAAAGASAALRVVADKHHTTDVLLGAAVGLASGYVLPTLLHYDYDDEPYAPLADGEVPPDVSPTVGVMPSAGPGYLGVQFGGGF